MPRQVKNGKLTIGDGKLKVKSKNAKTPTTSGGKNNDTPPTGGGANRDRFCKSIFSDYDLSYVENHRIYGYMDNLRKLAAGR
jgi:hypothetical protein